MRSHCASVSSRRIKIALLSCDLESHSRVRGNPAPRAPHFAAGHLQELLGTALNVEGFGKVRIFFDDRELTSGQRLVAEPERRAQGRRDRAAGQARGWVDRCRKALEAGDGTPPDLDGDAGALWLFVAGAEATRAILAGRFDDAYATYDRIRQHLEASTSVSRDRRLSVAYHQLGTVAQHRRDLVAAERWYRKSLEIKEALGDRHGMASSYHQLGWVAQQRGDLASAERWYRKSLEITKALGDRPSMALSYGQLGTMAQDRGDLAAAERWYGKSLEISEALGDRPTSATTYHNLGRVAQHRGDLAAAERWYRKSLEIREALGNRPGMAMTYGQLGLLADAHKDPATALDWTVRCIALFPEFPHPATGPGPGHLVRLTAALGVPALEASWKRCTGAPLPEHIRSAVAPK